MEKILIKRDSWKEVQYVFKVAGVNIDKYIFNHTRAEPQYVEVHVKDMGFLEILKLQKVEFVIK